MRLFRMAKFLPSLGPHFQMNGKLSWKRVMGAVMVAFCLQGCLVGPDYQKPDPVGSPDWDVMTLDGKTSSLPVSMADVPEVSWWQAFQNEELNRLIEQALDQNHDMRQAGFRVMEARALAKGAGAGLYPNVSVDGAYTRVRRSETILVAPTSGAPEGFAPPGANFDIWNSAIDLRWELDLWGRIRRSQEAFSAEAFASEMDRRGIVLSLISDVGQSYFRLRELDEQLEIAERNLLLQQDSLSLIRNRAQAGLISDLDVKRAEILVAQTASQIPELQRQRAVQRHQLELLTGGSPNTLALSAKPLRSIVVQPIIPIGLPAGTLATASGHFGSGRNSKSRQCAYRRSPRLLFPDCGLDGNRWFSNQRIRSMVQMGQPEFKYRPIGDPADLRRLYQHRTIGSG